MIFSSWVFAVFFAVVYSAYWALPSRRGRHVFLLLASYAFYMSWDVWLVGLIAGSTLLDYCVGRALEVAERRRRRQALLVLSIAGNLGILCAFKYADFFIVSLRELIRAAGVQSNLDTLGFILPIGISFYTFQTLSYTIDVYRRRIEPTRNVLEFALFVAFFPQLVAGPIVKAREFLPQLAERKRFEWRRLESGIVLFMVGLTKKILIADNLAMLVDPVFADPQSFVTRDLWIAMFCYGGQIYCDFSGYSDMAIAIAGVLGYDLPRNFASPYLAVGLSDFWRRWHISLSTWLRDYLYIPLGGSRLGRLLTYRNLMITMLLGGLWHGASWTFVVWGGLHGAALVVCRLLSGVVGEPASCVPNTPFLSRGVRRFVPWVLTLLAVHIAWVFFRCQPILLSDTLALESTAAALARAGYFVKHLFVPASVDAALWLPDKAPMLALLALMFAMQLYSEWTRRGRPRPVLPAPLAGLGYAAWIVALVVFSAENVAPFIYFQF
ncbi:MAG: MBOAT family protein [Planctomycetota bacterium]|nr:MBOAT family protein [Planctomycetota bacterium]